MKRNILLTAFFLVTATVFLPLTASAQGVSIGPRLGLNISTTKYEFSVEQYRDEYRSMIEPGTGVQFGVSLHCPITKSLFLQPEIQYSSLGYKFERTKSSFMMSGYSYENYNHEIRSHYLQFPVLLGYSFGKNKVRLLLNGGLYGGYWLNGKLTFNGHTNKIDFYENSYTYNGTDFQRFDAGVIGGLGLGFNTEEGIFIIDFRYLEGLVAFKKYELGIEGDGGIVKYKNRVYSLGVSYLFGKGK